MKRQVFLVWFFIFIVWAFYRAYFRLPEQIDEFLIKPLVFTLPVLFVVLYKENKSLAELGLFSTKRNFMLDLYIGVVIGVVFALEGLLANFIKYGNFSFTPLTLVRAGGGILPFLLLNLATSVWEEILGRGYLYKRLFEATKNQFWAASVSGFLFLLLHIPILFTRLHFSGMTLIIYPVSILILSIANSYVLTLRGSLFLPILIHAFWNMTVALYL